MCCKKMVCCRKLERSHITDKWGTDRRLLMVSREMSQVISFLLFLYLKLVVFKEKPKLELRNECKQSTSLKVTEKVAFNIASEASYVYILNRQKFIKNVKNGQF